MNLFSWPHAVSSVSIPTQARKGSRTPGERSGFSAAHLILSFPPPATLAAGRQVSTCRYATAESAARSLAHLTQYCTSARGAGKGLPIYGEKRRGRSLERTP